MHRQIKSFIVLAFIGILLAGCSSSNKFAASFGKRKYNKGYYWDRPAGRPTVSSGKPKELNGKYILKPVITANNAIPYTSNPGITQISASGRLKEVHHKISIPDISEQTFIQPVNSAVVVLNNTASTGYDNSVIGTANIVWLIIMITLSAIAVIILIAVIMEHAGAGLELLLFFISFLFLVAVILLLVHLGERNAVTKDLVMPMVDVLVYTFDILLSVMH